MPARVTIPKAKLSAFCREHQVRRLSFFGSALRPDFRPDSDLDVLVEFDVTARPGLFELARMETELSRMVGGRRVDLREPEELSPLFRSEILNHAEVQFAAT